MSQCLTMRITRCILARPRSSTVTARPDVPRAHVQDTSRHPASDQLPVLLDVHPHNNRMPMSILTHAEPTAHETGAWNLDWMTWLPHSTWWHTLPTGRTAVNAAKRGQPWTIFASTCTRRKGSA